MKEMSTSSLDLSREDAKTPSYLTTRQQENKLFSWWYRLASPPRPASSAPFKEKERFRRGRTGSQIIPALYLLLVISLPAGFAGTNPYLGPVLIGGLITLTFATILNRLGVVNLTGFIVVATFIAYPTLNIMTNPGGMNMGSLPLFGLLILPLLCAVSFLPEWWIFVVAVVNILFTLFALATASLPQTAELSSWLILDLPGTITPIIVSQLIVSVVAYLWVHSTTLALKRADRAEEIAKLEHDLALQAESAAQQKQLLETSIKKIIETHTRVANGDFNARVPLTHDNVLWQVSGSLNNLLARVHRLRQDASELQRLRFALAQAREENRRLTRILQE